MNETPPNQVFPSKRDAWLTAVIWAGAVACVLGAATILGAKGPLGAKLALGVVPALIAPFMLWVLYGTHYTFSDGVLVIRSGPLRYRVPLEEVVSVTPSRNPLSSPALSLDRIQVVYGRRKILISPAPRSEFLEVMARHAPQLVRRGDTLRVA